MSKTSFRWQRYIGFVMILLVATACFRNAGDESTFDGTLVAQGNPSATPTETDTPQPSDTPTPTEEETEESLDQPIGDRSTSTPTATDTATTTPTATSTSTPAAVAQQQTPAEPTDEFPFTATAYIIEVTQTEAYPLTLTAAAQGLGATPTPTATPTSFATDSPSQPVPSGADCVHQVRRGTTMYRLSVWYGLPVQQIATYNSIVNPALIREGQKITIPNCGTTNYTPPPTYTPTPAPTQFGTGGQGQGGGVATQAPSSGTTFIQHTVSQYETLFQISMQYGVPVQQIAAANGITNTDLIYMNDVLQIPVQQ